MDKSRRWSECSRFGQDETVGVAKGAGMMVIEMMARMIPGGALRCSMTVRIVEQGEGAECVKEPREIQRELPKKKERKK